MTFRGSENQNEHGIGLGLSLCKQMIGYMGSMKNFLIKSEENVGTMVGVLLNTKENQENNKKVL